MAGLNTKWLGVPGWIWLGGVGMYMYTRAGGRGEAGVGGFGQFSGMRPSAA